MNMHIYYNNKQEPDWTHPGLLWEERGSQPGICSHGSAGKPSSWTRRETSHRSSRSCASLSPMMSVAPCPARPAQNPLQPATGKYLPSDTNPTRCHAELSQNARSDPLTPPSPAPPCHRLRRKRFPSSA